MRKLKVFLSKSKNGDYDLGLKTKDLLLKAGAEVVEYTGGTYSPDLMLSCDVLIMVPALIQQHDGVSYVDYVGKGQFTELTTWRNTKHPNSALIVNTTISKDLCLKRVLSLVLIEGEEDWKVKYGKMRHFSSFYKLEIPQIIGGVNNTSQILIPNNFYPDLQSYLADEFFSDITTMPIQGTKNPCKEIIGRGECPDMSLNTTQPIARPLHLATYKKLKR